VLHWEICRHWKEEQLWERTCVCGDRKAGAADESNEGYEGRRGRKGEDMRRRGALQQREVYSIWKNGEKEGQEGKRLGADFDVDIHLLEVAGEVERRVLASHRRGRRKEGGREQTRPGPAAGGGEDLTEESRALGGKRR
jgi:hypothetical protein